MWQTFKRYLVKNYGYDAGHSLLGPLLGLLLYAFGLPPVLAAALGGTLYAIPKEIYDSRKSGGFHLDNAADFVSYQTSWPAVYLADQQPGLAIAMVLMVAIAYSGLVIWKLSE